ncbi:hypothetical protein [Aeromonas veronii]|uniref:hypothetical protein n=1 Tax=Aeromonas veronii TaxID=654 RepID=UPI0012680A5E|nr:hypothetical protein [Aeromonas veronii]QMS74792.1 hypothetical protein M001_011710 [Aeromonas veronii Hm21]
MTSQNDHDYKRHWQVLWNVRLGIRYHMHLQNFHSRFGKFVTAFTLILSTSAGATLINANVDFAKIFAFSAAVLQVLELVVDSKAKLFLHSNLRQHYIRLESELLSGGDELTKIEFGIIKNKIASIEVEEPPIITSLMKLCHNELVKVYRCADNIESMKCWEKLIAYWFS